MRRGSTLVPSKVLRVDEGSVDLQWKGIGEVAFHAPAKCKSKDESVIHHAIPNNK